MNDRITRLENDYKLIKSGKISSDMFNHILVNVFNKKTPLNKIGQVSIQSSNKILISVFDNLLVNSVIDAIKQNDSNLSPIADNNNIIVNIPKPSKESRELLIKSVSKMAEQTKLEIRQIRKEKLDTIKKIKGSISEDDTRRFNKDIDNLVEKLIEKVVKKLKDKETEILSS